MVYPLQQAGGAEQERLLLVEELNGLETFISTAEQIVITSLVTCPVAIESLGRKAVIWSPGRLVTWSSRQCGSLVTWSSRQWPPVNDILRSAFTNIHHG